MTAWPTQKIDTTHLDQGSDSPAHARAAIKAMADTINAMIDAFGDPNGVATLDAAGLHPFRQMRGEVFTATERTRLANLSEPTPTPTPTPRPTPRGRKTFTTPGSFTWRAPAGVTRVRVQLRGGSGGDGDGYTWTWSGRGGADGGETALRGDGTLTLGTARGGKGGRRAVSGRAGTDGADGTSAAVWAFSQSSVSRQVQLVVPSPVSAGYIVIEWG